MISSVKSQTNAEIPAHLRRCCLQRSRRRRHRPQLGLFYIEQVNAARQTQSVQDTTALDFAATAYTHDHNGRDPDVGKWEQKTAPYFASKTADIVHPPGLVGGTQREFSLNPTVAGKTEAQISKLRTRRLLYQSVSAQPSACDNLEH